MPAVVCNDDQVLDANIRHTHPNIWSYDMDTIVFSKIIVRTDDYPNGYSCAKIAINDKPLLDMAKEYEMNFLRGTEKEDMAGCYEYNFVISLYKELFHCKYKSDENRIYALICGGCLCDECWPFNADVEIEKEYVVWKNLHNHWLANKPGYAVNYADFPIFRFDTHQYMQAVEVLKSFACDCHHGVDDDLEYNMQDDNKQCVCLDGIFYVYKQRRIRFLAYDSLNDSEVNIYQCTDCGRYWLNYYYTHDSCENVGRSFWGLIDKDKIKEISADTAALYLQSIDWYWCGGGYYSGKKFKTSGKITI